jgi:ribonuclease-3
LRLRKPDLEKELEYSFQDKELLTKALTHSSFAYEAQTEKINDNEVLEFLGDSILGFILSDFLCATFPYLTEGELSKLKSAMASTTALAEFAKRIGLNHHVRLGKGEEKSGGRNKKTILAGTFEAVVAALYLEGGIEEVQRFLNNLFGAFLKRVDMSKFLVNDYKSALQEYLQSSDSPGPVYRTVTTKGPDHKKRFIVEVSYREKRLAKATGVSKKDAEQKAAQKAVKSLLGKKIRTLTSDTFLLKKKK